MSGLRNPRCLAWGADGAYLHTCDHIVVKQDDGINEADGIYPIELKSYELDHRGEIPLWVIYRFLQEAAEFNAVELGFDTESMLKQALTWMLVRLQLRVGRVPSGRTLIRAESWPSAVESRFAKRDFRLWWNDAAEPFAVASSAWLLIDVNRKRPVTVENVIGREHLRCTATWCTIPSRP